jgi:acetyltransferase-like isoleucine patch superfamily enzyme
MAIKSIIPNSIREYLRWLRYVYRFRDINIPQSAIIGTDVKIGQFSKIYPHVELCSATIGKFSYLGHNSKLLHAEVGSFCSIAPESIIGGYLHPVETWVSTSPAFYSSGAQCGASFTNISYFNEVQQTFIGNDVWIGYRAIVLPGVRVSDGAIIAAGAVVTKNVGPYEIVAGVPAKVIRTRFTESEITWLLDVKWWNLPIEYLSRNANAFKNIETLRKILSLDNKNVHENT